LASARERILANYVGFLNRLKNSASWEVRILSEVETREAGSVTGRNVINIRGEFGRNPRMMTPKELRELYQGVEVPLGEGWRLALMRDMLEEWQDRMEAGEEGNEMDLLKSYIDLMAEI
jgi:hypothetical protein